MRPYLLLLLSFIACGDPEPSALSGDIGERLAQLPGVTVQERTDLLPESLAGYRYFWLTVEQPVDHDDEDGPVFTQRLTLLHRADDAPVVLYGGGYNLPASPAPARVELTRLVEGNQLAIEHRFFTPSRPEPADWSKLTIRQSAADYHAVVVLGKRLYPASKWLVTGGSKGGETAIYHRRFYPDDVDGTVAYVAPLVLGAPDDRFVPYLRAIGPDTCRDALAAFQRQALSGWRDELLARLEALPYGYQRLGAERALEHAVLELPFALWQYSGEVSCANVPAPGGSATSAFDFIDLHSQWYMFSDPALEQYGPYYYQAAVELGYPLIDESAVADLLQSPMTDVATTYAPAGVPTVFDPGAMADVQSWVATSGKTLMFIYGVNDPWSAGKYSLGAAADSFLYEIPLANHGARIGLLTEPALSEATATVRRWAGVTVPPAKRSLPEPDYFEPERPR